MSEPVIKPNPIIEEGYREFLKEREGMHRPTPHEAFEAGWAWATMLIGDVVDNLQRNGDSMRPREY